jgi:hypothetical protein
MSHSTDSADNKQPKVYFAQYLTNFDEPQDDLSRDTPELEAELLENTYVMKRRIRRMAEKMRNLYS